MLISQNDTRIVDKIGGNLLGHILLLSQWLSSGVTERLPPALHKGCGPLMEPIARGISSSDTTDDSEAISEDEKFNDDKSSDEASDNYPQAPDVDTSIVTDADACRNCLPIPTSTNKNNEELVNALLKLNLKAMYNDMKGNNRLILRPTGSVDFLLPSAEVWRPVEEIHQNYPSQPSNRPLKRARKKMASADSFNMLDRHNKTMAAILTRFRNMVLAATDPLPTAAAIPQASLNAMSMNNEVSALVCISLTLLPRGSYSAMLARRHYCYNDFEPSYPPNSPGYLNHLYFVLCKHKHEPHNCDLIKALASAEMNQTTNAPAGKQIKEIENLLALSREIKQLMDSRPATQAR
ncbi:hypothetical protein NUW58_g7533 [Xylaria curta]|uniref:Uncharacterized protein n=1 Tax=Xylaria curta TaxID=42375 RepID=A0ACC1NG57_9PEZI|nr:hypothetical protein NUW58_g7533 [Xylaria curta]